jgi:hypothetical protein
MNGNSLRFRIARSEVARLLAGECLEETVYFAPQANARFTYGLQLAASISAPAVQYTESRVVVLIPVDQANTWGTTDQVGIAANIGLGGFGSLALLIEKDFACLDRSGEENQDTFPNPNANTTC